MFGFKFSGEFFLATLIYFKSFHLKGFGFESHPGVFAHGVPTSASLQPNNKHVQYLVLTWWFFLCVLVFSCDGLATCPTCPKCPNALWPLGTDTRNNKRADGWEDIYPVWVCKISSSFCLVLVSFLRFFLDWSCSPFLIISFHFFSICILLLWFFGFWTSILIVRWNYYFLEICHLHCFIYDSLFCFEFLAVASVLFC